MTAHLSFPRLFIERLGALATALAIGIAANLASAEESDSATATELETVVVEGERRPEYTPPATSAASGLELSPRETPQSVTVITRQRLDDQNLQSLRDVLDNTTGVYSYAYDTERVVFTSRGFFIDNLMYDGVPAATNFNTDSADETLDTGLYERIEVVRGATGLMTGAGSPSASVNLVRKRADSRDFAASTAVTTGSWDDTRTLLDVSTPLTGDGSVRARSVGVYQYRQSYQDYYENEKQVFYTVVDADLSANTLLSIGYDYQDTQPQANTWGSFPLFLGDGTRANWSRSVTTAPKWTFWDKRKQTGFAELRQALVGDWALRATLTHRQADDDLALFYVYGYPDPEDGTGLYPYAYRNTLKTVQDSLDLHGSGPFRLFGRDHELVVGYNGSRVDIDGALFEHGELADPGNFFEWDGSYPEPEFAAQGTNIVDVDTRQHGLYAATRLSLADPLKLIAGARYTTWKTDYYYLYSGSFQHKHEPTTPYAGLIYDLDRSWSLFGSYTAIFNPQNKQNVDGSFLDPVEGNSIEAGIKGEHFDGRLNTALTLFDTHQDNVGIPATDAEGNPIYLPDGVTQASQAVDGTRTRGFEIEASGSPRVGWNLSLGASHYRLEDSDGESVKSYIPRSLVRLFTTWNIPGALRGLTVGGGANWQSKSDLDVASPDGLTNIEQGDVTLLGVMARYQVTPALSVQLNGSNLLDEMYYVLDEYGNLYYGTPAMASAGLNYRF